MTVVKTMGKFCYIQCDTQNCNKKIEKNDEKTLPEFAKLCGWKSKSNQWTCPDCQEKEKAKKKAKKTPKTRKKA